jgi:anti-sigma regulatory factor (Ser/Thr protein kinase)
VLTTQTQAKFPKDLRSVAAARRFVVGVLAQRPLLLRERAGLIVSELATNAVAHGQTDFSISVCETAYEVRVEVRDAGRGRPVVGSPSPLEPTGRGLLIVEAVSDDFGVEEREGEKSVWFTISTSTGAGRAEAH